MSDSNKENISEILFDPKVSEILELLENGPEHESKICEHLSITIDDLTKRLEILVKNGLVIKSNTQFLGNALAVEGLMQFEKELDAEEYTVTVDMYTQNKNTGVFAIITRDGSDENDISVNIFDPSGLEIATMDVSKNSGQITFDIVKDGKYEAVIQNNHETVIPITVAMGSNSGALAQSIVTTGVAVLLMGLFGMMATALYVFKLKRKT